MHAATDRLEFAPPPNPGQLRALGLAVLAHVFLLAALTWGVHWRSEPVSTTAEAELWSAVPQQAAPKLVEVPPEPSPPVPEKKVAPAPVPAVAPPPIDTPPPDADIALEREKLHLKTKLALERKQELEKQRLEKLKQEKLLLEKQRLQEKRDQDRKAAEAKKTLEDKKKAAEDSKRKEAVLAQQEAKKLELQRQENLKRMAGLAGATGTPSATGTAQRASGPSASYGQRLAALFMNNVSYPNRESISGNPKATVEVRVSSSGLIMSSRLVTSSGVPSWDAAALRAVEKTERIPPDENGNFVPVFPVDFRPKDK